MKTNSPVGCALERTIWKFHSIQPFEHFLFDLENGLHHFNTRVSIEVAVGGRCAQERTLQVARGLA
jgi:hypothetical protein